MANASAHEALAACISTFEEQLRDLAEEIVRSIVQQETRRLPKPPRARVAAPVVATKQPRGRRASVKKPPTPVREADVTAPPAVEPARGRKPTWTRDTIIDALVKLLINKTGTDAAFIDRHGPKGLVPAARRMFGRFDAALNVASLRISQQLRADEELAAAAAAAAGSDSAAGAEAPAR